MRGKESEPLIDTRGEGRKGGAPPPKGRVRREKTRTKLRIRKKNNTTMMMKERDGGQGLWRGVQKGRRQSGVGGRHSVKQRRDQRIDARCHRGHEFSPPREGHRTKGLNGGNRESLIL